jgi:hypothetical protein
VKKGGYSLHENVKDGFTRLSFTLNRRLEVATLPFLCLQKGRRPFMITSKEGRVRKK